MSGLASAYSLQGRYDLKSLQGDPALDELLGKVRERARQLAEAGASGAKPAGTKPPDAKPAGNAATPAGR